MIKHIAIVTLFAFGCGDSNKPPAAEPAPATSASADPVVAEASADPAPVDQGAKLQPAEDVFQWSFAEAIAKDDLEMWRGLLSARMAARLGDEKARVHFDAWRIPLEPVAQKLRDAEAKIVKSGDRARIQFVGVTIPGDADDVMVTVTMEQGVFKIDEN